jgi:hypothetical protein
MMKESISNTQLLNEGFSQRIAGRYDKSKLFTLGFSPLISARGFVRFLSRWVELVYALPYIILRKELSTFFRESRTHVITQPLEQIWNVLVHFKRTLSPIQFHTETGQNIRLLREMVRRYEKLARPGQSTLFTLKGITSPQSDTATYNYKLAERMAAGDLRVSSYKPGKQSASETGDKYIQSEWTIASHLVTPVNSGREARKEGHSRIPIYNGPSSKGQELEVEKKSAEIPRALLAANNVSSLFGYQPLILRYQPLLTRERRFPIIRDIGTTILNSFGRFSYPEVELITPKATLKTTGKIINMEKETAPKTAQPPKIDVKHLTDQVYRLLERKIGIERERRGL